MQLLGGSLRRPIQRVLTGIGLVMAVPAVGPGLVAQDSLAGRSVSSTGLPDRKVWPADEPERRKTSPNNKPQQAMNMLEIWSAGARNAPLKTRYGMKRDRELYITGIRFSRQFKAGSHGAWEYTNDFLPMVVATQTPFYRDTAFTRTIRIPGRGGRGDEMITQEVDSMILFNRTVYGAGWAPLGLRYRTGHRRAQVVMGLSAGAVFFNRRMPDPGETRFNFTLDGTVLLHVPVGKHGVSVGYQFNHISNANTGRVNPGMNSSMLHIGWGVRR